MLRLAVVALALGIGSGCSGETAGTPCERRAKVEVRVVDNDSPHMRKLFMQVSVERRSEALAAGVRGEADKWPTQIASDGMPVGDVMKTDYYLRATTREALENYVAAFGAAPDDRDIALEYAAEPTLGETLGARYWRTYYVIKRPVLDTQSIASVSRGTDPNTSRPRIVLTFTSEGRSAFARSTKANVGRKMAILIDGTVLAAPIINSEITGGRLSIPARSAAEADVTFNKLGCVK